jgi:hypothetical protein
VRLALSNNDATFVLKISTMRVKELQAHENRLREELEKVRCAIKIEMQRRKITQFSVVCHRL